MTERGKFIEKAICQITNPKDCGFILFTEYKNYTEIKVNLYGLPEGPHGIHIHRTADMRSGCRSLGPHFNPLLGSHKDVNEKGNHVGDLGNIYVSSNGTCNQTIISGYLPLLGPNQVIGRSVVIHEKIDDLGKGTNEESQETGNSGNRIACGIIGYL